MSLEDLVPRVDARALEAALEEANGLPLSSSRRADLIRVTAVLLRSLLRKSPLRPWRRALAVGVAELTCELNGFALALTDLERTALLDEADHPVGDRQELERWLAKRVRRLPPSEAAQAQVRAGLALGRPAAHRPSLYVSTRFSFAPGELKRRLAVVADDIRRVADEVAAARRKDLPLTSEEEQEFAGRPSGFMAVDSPWREEDWCESRESCRVNRGRLRRANVLVVLAPEGGSQTTGTELDLVHPDVPVLYLAVRGHPRPFSIKGNLGRRPTSSDRVFEWHEVGPAVREFLATVWPQVEASWHRSELRGLIYRPLADAFGRRFQRLGEAEVERRFDARGLQAELQEDLVNPHALPLVGEEVLEWARSEFEIEFNRQPGQGATPTLSEGQRDNLTLYQHEYGVAPAEVNGLRKEAERQLALGVLRYSLASPREWRKLHLELRVGL